MSEQKDAPTRIQAFKSRVLQGLLDMVDDDQVRKGMVERVLAPSLKLVCAQLLPYLLVIMAMTVIMLMLMLMTFCLTYMTYMSRARAAAR